MKKNKNIVTGKVFAQRKKNNPLTKYFTGDNKNKKRGYI